MDKKIKVSDPKWAVVGDVVLFVFALICFVYSGWWLYNHQMEVLNAVRNLTNLGK